MTATAVWAREGSSVPGKLTMGAEFSYFKYEELDLMEQAGPLFGVYAEYAMRTPENGKVSSSEGKWIMRPTEQASLTISMNTSSRTMSIDREKMGHPGFFDRKIRDYDDQADT